MPLLEKPQRSDKLSTQPRYTREPLPRAQGFAPHAEHWQIPTTLLHLPCLSTSLLHPIASHCFSLTPTTTDPSLFHRLTSTLQIIQSMFHQCFLLDWERLLLLCTPSMSSWYQYLVRLRGSPQLRLLFCLTCLPHVAMHSLKLSR
jgi:hypothetical protein